MISLLSKSWCPHASIVVLWVNTGAFRRIPWNSPLGAKKTETRSQTCNSPFTFKRNFQDTLSNPFSNELKIKGLGVCVWVCVYVCMCVIVSCTIQRTELKSLKRTTSGLSMDRVEILVHIRYWCCLEAAVSQWKCC